MCSGCSCGCSRRSFAETSATRCPLSFVTSARMRRRPGGSGSCGCGGARSVTASRHAPREHVAVLARDATYGLRLMRKYPLASRRGDTDHRARSRREHRDVHRRERRAPPTAVRRPRPAGERPPADAQGRSADSVDAISNLERACRCRRVARGYTMSSPVLTGAGAPNRLRLECFSANMFSMLGASPVIGRTFAAHDDSPAPRRSWSSVIPFGHHLGRDPSVGRR